MYSFCFVIKSYDELLRCLAPAPVVVRGDDGEVRHVGVAVQVVHPLPHRPRPHLMTNIMVPGVVAADTDLRPVSGLLTLPHGQTPLTGTLAVTRPAAAQSKQDLKSEVVRNNS